MFNNIYIVRLKKSLIKLIDHYARVLHSCILGIWIFNRTLWSHATVNNT